MSEGYIPGVTPINDNADARAYIRYVLKELGDDQYTQAHINTFNKFVDPVEGGFDVIMAIKMTFVHFRRER